MSTILQSSLMTNFLYPLVLMFVLVFAILEKINMFGDKDDNKKSLHAILALVIALIFVGAVFPKLVVSNLVQFMTVGLAIIFIGLIMWGFVSGKGELPEGMVTPLGIIIGLAVVFATLWATGAGGPIVDALKKFFSFLFDSSWSGAFWTNFLLIAVIAVVIGVVLSNGQK